MLLPGLVMSDLIPEEIIRKLGIHLAPKNKTSLNINCRKCFIYLFFWIQLFNIYNANISAFICDFSSLFSEFLLITGFKTIMIDYGLN